MSPEILFKENILLDKNKTNLGNGLILEIIEGISDIAVLYRNGVQLKKVDLSDRVAKRLFVVETVELGAIKNRLASAFNISRQTIHNYLETKKHFGLEGLIHSYNPSDSRSRREQRELHSGKRFNGNKAEQLAQIRQKEREEREKAQLPLNLPFGYTPGMQEVQKSEQLFCEEHDWKPTRYAGVFVYLITLVSGWRWLELLMGYFGNAYKIFMVFLLMAARNIRSIEQLKNVLVGEAGILLGLNHLPAKPKIWEWFYSAADKRISTLLLTEYFHYQIRAGVVGLWLWFTDGHLLPYTGKERVRFSYNTQRRMPFPGRTNLVTCDSSGRVVDFEIQEGKGDLRGYILELYSRWRNECPEAPVIVFDREGYGAAFFGGLVKQEIPFVTWEKNVDSKELAGIDKGRYSESFKFNGKRYSIFEEEKSFSYIEEGVNPEKDRHDFKLRHIFIWNRKSGRRVCGLAWTADKKMSTADCARAILSRWGASENTFKHINTRHPFHYQPGFKLVESSNQEIINPELREKESLIKRVKSSLNKLYKNLVKSKEVLRKDGTPRKNSIRAQIKRTIAEKEFELKRLNEEKKQLPEKVDVSRLENYGSIKKIDNEGKNLFDFVTSSVWNARKQMVDWLSPFFNQENEIIDLFYAISNSHGWIKSTGTEVIVRLEALQQPKRRFAQEQLCRKLTNLGAQIPIGKWLNIEVGESPL